MNMTDFTTEQILICSMVSVILGIVIAVSFGLKQNKSKSFLVTIALLPIIVQVIIMLVNGSIGTGIAVMGAFSLVRFRSVPGSALDICGIFLAMAAGLASGTGYIYVGIALVIAVCAIKIILTLLPFGVSSKEEKELHITIPENLDYDGAFDDIFSNYAKNSRLVEVKTTNMGSLFKLRYLIELKDAKNEKKLIDELRCRNGNLEIMCSSVKVADESMYM